MGTQKCEIDSECDIETRRNPNSPRRIVEKEQSYVEITVENIKYPFNLEVRWVHGRRVQRWIEFRFVM